MRHAINAGETETLSHRGAASFAAGIRHRAQNEIRLRSCASVFARELVAGSEGDRAYRVSAMFLDEKGPQDNVLTLYEADTGALAA